QSASVGRAVLCTLVRFTEGAQRSDAPCRRACRCNAFTTMIDPALLLQGYCLGVFPTAMEDDSIEWFSPDPRAILPLEDFHVPHALRRLVRKKVFATTIN